MERNKNVSCLFHCTKLSSLCYVLYSFSERIVVLENAAIIVDLFYSHLYYDIQGMYSVWAPGL